MRRVQPSAGIAGQLDEWIASAEFSCLAAKSAVRRKVLRPVELGAMASEEATAALHAALTDFVNDQLNPDEDFATLVALFEGPLGLSENEFSELLWTQLADLHTLDVAKGSVWAPDAEADPTSPKFSFSVSGHPFFIVGMHDNASRISRRFSRPAMAFNSHHQFHRLKSTGVYGGLQRRIRQREMRLQQSINPNLAEFGLDSEARQYAGSATDAQWQCPFASQQDAEFRDHSE